MPNEDFIEFGESGLVPLKDGWFLNRGTGEKIAPDGRVFNASGDLIFDPKELDNFPSEFLDGNDEPTADEA